MRSILRIALIVSSAVAAFPLAADDGHRTAHAEVAVGAELEILPRTTDLGVLEGPNPSTRIMLTPSTETASATRSATADSLALGTIGADDPAERVLFNSMYARAHATAMASNDVAEASAIASPNLDLINALDTPMLLTLIVRVPGRFPTAGGVAVPNDYFSRGSVDDNFAEYAGGTQVVSIIPTWDYGTVTGDGVLRPLYARYENRDPVDLTGVHSGPGTFDTFGVPFSIEYRIALPPSVVDLDDHSELRIETLTLYVKAFADTASILDSTTSPVIFKGIRSFCELAPPRRLIEFLPERDPLCRAGRFGAAQPPICSCTRDLALRSQRCSFVFSDLQVTQQLPAPALPGEQVQVDWSIDAFTDGDYWFRPEIFVNGKWVAVDAKSKPSGKLASGKESRAQLAFAMPSKPTILRTHMFHLAKGAKTPVESQIDTVIALKKVKPQEK